MKTSKITCLILLITGICLLYVWQQNQIVELAYERQKRLRVLTQDLDQNMILRYNLMTLASAGNLTKSLKIFDTDYEIIHFSQIVDLRSTEGKNNLESTSINRQKTRSSKDEGRQNIFLSLFSPKSQAQAQTR